MEVTIKGTPDEIKKVFLAVESSKEQGIPEPKTSELSFEIFKNVCEGKMTINQARMAVGLPPVEKEIGNKLLKKKGME